MAQEEKASGIKPMEIEEKALGVIPLVTNLTIEKKEKLSATNPMAQEEKPSEIVPIVINPMATEEKPLVMVPMAIKKEILILSKKTLDQEKMASKNHGNQKSLVHSKNPLKISKGFQQLILQVQNARFFLKRHILEFSVV